MRLIATFTEDHVHYTLIFTNGLQLECAAGVAFWAGASRRLMAGAC